MMHLEMIVRIPLSNHWCCRQLGHRFSLFFELCTVTLRLTVVLYLGGFILGKVTGTIVKCGV